MAAADSNARRFHESCNQARQCANARDLAGVQGAIGEAWRLLELLRPVLRVRGELRELEALREAFQQTVSVCRDKMRWPPDPQEDPAGSGSKSGA